MIGYIALLDKLKASGAIVPLDYHLALFLVKQSQLNDPIMQSRFAFLIVWLSIEVRSGHVCINLADIHPDNLEYRFSHELIILLFTELVTPTLVDWQSLCLELGCTMISDGKVLSPLVLSNNQLYFQRMWQYETQVANYFNHSLQSYPPSDSVKKIINQLFIVNQQASDIDWQKIATATAVSKKLTIISGGPGTGKTTTISKILATLVAAHQLQSNLPLRIIAAAPTGKAAARLTESLSAAIATLPLSPDIMHSIPVEAVTLHRLLGAKLTSNQYIYHQDNKLSVDLLLIDEASMIDLPMMASVIAALPDNARLILLGDKEQLSSVEAGAIFGDLCALLNYGYSAEHVDIINHLTGYQLIASTSQSSIADSICLLQKSYRFDSQSGIGRLANYIKEGQSYPAIKLLISQEYNDITCYDMANNHQYQHAIHWCINAYQAYYQVIKSNPTNVAGILSAFNQFRLLCALRDGPYGVQGLNKVIENGLEQHNTIPFKKQDIWYIGRPIMILKNNFSLGLFNGDIGITLFNNEDNKLKVYFQLPNGEIKGFSPFRLPEHETTYAMTIHKSQGSEFEHVSIILPNEYSPILTRSLLYTAVTRARKQVTLFASQPILDKTIKSQTIRQSGLANLLV